MTHRILIRAAVGAASLAVIAPLAACTSENGPAPTSSPQTSSPAGSSDADDDGAAGSGTADSSGDSSGSTSDYADGTYTARGVYGGAPSYMDFTVTLEDGVITEVTSELMPDNNDTSRGFQERFAAAVPDEVTGRSIADLEVGVIAGASGCADGFNAALDTIRDQASADGASADDASSADS